jgi:hypothetical protein
LPLLCYSMPIRNRFTLTETAGRDNCCYCTRRSLRLTTTPEAAPGTRSSIVISSAVSFRKGPWRPRLKHAPVSGHRCHYIRILRRIWPSCVGPIWYILRVEIANLYVDFRSGSVVDGYSWHRTTPYFIDYFGLNRLVDGRSVCADRLRVDVRPRLGLRSLVQNLKEPESF